MAKRYLINDTSHAEINRVLQIIQKDIEGTNPAQNLHASPFVTTGSDGKLIGVPHSISASTTGQAGVGAAGTPQSPGNPGSAGLSGGGSGGAPGAAGPPGDTGPTGPAGADGSSQRWLRRRGL